MRTGYWALLSALLTAPVALQSASAAETCWSEGSAQFYDAMHYCVSSVLPPSSRWRYGPENLVGMEGGQHLAWCEGARGWGIGEAITLRIDRGAPFRRLLIANGYGKTDKSYFENARVRIFHITTDTGLMTSVRLPDQAEPVPVTLPAAGEFRWVRLEIGEVYTGSRYQDTCVDFVSPDFEYEETLAPAPVPPPPPIVALPPVELAPPPAITGPADDPFGDLGMPDPDELRLPPQ